jgi:hypothetical protein
MATTALFSNPLWAADPNVPGSKLEWKLNGLHVIQQGQLTKLPEGILLQGHILEAEATSDNPTVIADGKLRLELSVFSPKGSQHGQKKGFWYVRGKWSLIDSRAPQAPAGSRILPGVLAGSVLAELPFNPTEASKAWEAHLRLPISTVVSVDPTLDPTQTRHKARGEGELRLNGKAGGSATLSFAMWRKI